MSDRPGPAYNRAVPPPNEASKRRPLGDPLQVNLRWLVRMLLLVVVLPNAVLTAVGIVAIITRQEVRELVFGVLVVAFAVSVIAGSFLLFFLARRGARLARIQETFLSHISHELRTPLAGIRLHTQILEAEQPDPETRLSLEAIRRETGRMQELVERLLAWRQVRSPKSFYRSVIAWNIRYPRVHFWAAETRTFAERTTLRWLQRFWEDDQERIKQLAKDSI